MFGVFLTDYLNANILCQFHRLLFFFNFILYCRQLQESFVSMWFVQRFIFLLFIYLLQQFETFFILLSFCSMFIMCDCGRRTEQFLLKAFWNEFEQLLKCRHSVLILRSLNFLKTQCLVSAIFKNLLFWSKLRCFHYPHFLVRNAAFWNFLDFGLLLQQF